MVTRMAAAAFLLSACTFHTGDTRSTGSDGEDVLVGEWLVNGEYTVTFERQVLSNPKQQLAGGTQWHRETEHIITVDTPTGPETVQVHVDPDLQGALLRWRSGSQRDSSLTLETTVLTRSPPP